MSSRRPMVVSLVGLPAVGKSSAVTRLAARGLPVASEHDPVTAAVLSSGGTTSTINAALGFILYEYQLALRFAHSSARVLVRDRGIEDTQYVLERLVGRKDVPAELLEACNHSQLLHSDRLVLLRLDDKTRRQRAASRGRSPEHAAATRKWEEDFGAGYEAWMLQKGVPVLEVTVDIMSSDDIAALVERSLPNYVPPATESRTA